jgi:hypothetical protein
VVHFPVALTTSYLPQLLIPAQTHDNLVNTNSRTSSTYQVYPIFAT